MTSNYSVLTNFKSHTGGLVTSDDGVQSKIVVVDMIVIDGIPILNDILFVFDLGTNLIRVGQHCDDEFIVIVH